MRRKLTRLLGTALCAGILLGACDEDDDGSCMWTDWDIDQACVGGCGIAYAVCLENADDDPTWNLCLTIRAECVSSCGE